MVTIQICLMKPHVVNNMEQNQKDAELLKLKQEKGV